MDYQAFTQSLKDNNLPVLPPWLAALWYDAKGDWKNAHDLVNDLSDERSAWVHAYLHRKEGDTGNAGYWYRRAGKPIPSISLDNEWVDLVKSLL